ncbi:MAG: glycosyltransferase family 4 protein [Maricaulaceae bacterium]|jgi:glycosyltransferase involved in cell wall biosynthesis
MKQVTVEELLSRELKKHAPPKALGILSRRFQSSGDAVCLEACAQLLQKLVRNPEEFNAAFWSLDYQLFARGKSLRPKVIERVRYKRMARAHFAFLDRLAADLKLPAPSVRAEPIRRVAIVSQQVLLASHSPTMVALEVATTLGAHAEVEPLIVNANTLPLRPASTFHPPYVANARADTGAHAMTYKDRDVRVWSAGAAPFSIAKLQGAIDALAAFEPDVVFSIGSCSVVGDLAARFVPTIAWPSTQQEPVTAAQLVINRDAEFSSSAIDWASLGAPEPLFVREDFNLDTVPPKSSAVSREILDVPEDAFVYVIVGTRLSDELTPQYQEVLARILAAREDARLVIVGPKTLQASPVLGPYVDRIRLVGHVDDLRALYEACDCFLNPPRQGGGNSAYIAMHENLPIVTLDDCDVQMTIGEGAACADLPAYEALALALAERGAIYDERCERSRLRVAALDKPEQAAAKLMGHAETARRRFEEARQAVGA